MGYNPFAPTVAEKSGDQPNNKNFTNYDVRIPAKESNSWVHAQVIGPDNPTSVIGAKPDIRAGYPDVPFYVELVLCVINQDDAPDTLAAEFFWISKDFRDALVSVAQKEGSDPMGKSYKVEVDEAPDPCRRGDKYKYIVGVDQGGGAIANQEVTKECPISVPFDVTGIHCPEVPVVNGRTPDTLSAEYDIEKQ